MRGFECRQGLPHAPAPTRGLPVHRILNHAKRTLRETKPTGKSGCCAGPGYTRMVRESHGRDGRGTRHTSSSISANYRVVLVIPWVEGFDPIVAAVIGLDHSIRCRTMSSHIDSGTVDLIATMIGFVGATPSASRTMTPQRSSLVGSSS